MNITQKLRKPLQIDHETGDIDIPGFGRLPLVGPTSGEEYKRLKESAEPQQRALNARILMLMSTMFVCRQCKKHVPGHEAIFKPHPETGEPMLSCPHDIPEGKCSGDLVPLAPGGRAA